jgi:hypothetical protein
MMGMFDVTLQKRTAKKNAALIFSFTQLVGLYIIQAFDIVIPVPDGEIDTARRIISTLGGEVGEEEK